MIAVTCFAVNDARGQTLLWSHQGADDFDRIDDFDGDGVGDVVILDSSIPSVLSGRDGSQLAKYASISQSAVVAGIGDQDGDGVPDFLVGCPFYLDVHGVDVGQVKGISGATGTVFYSYTGVDNRMQAEQGVGSCVRGIGDIDGDGLPDFAYGVSESLSLIWGWPGPSEVRERVNGGGPGADTLLGGFFYDFFIDYSLAPIGDVDGDGASDFAVGFNSFSGHGNVDIRSGKTGTLILSIAGPAAVDQFGISVNSCGDQDGDGIRDLIVGAPLRVVGPITPGSAMIYSSATGQLLHQFDGEFDGQKFGGDVDGLDDVDGDGFDDVVIASSVHPSRTQVFSSATGREVERLDGGYRVRNVGDLDGDGHDDIVLFNNSGSIDAWHVAPFLGIDAVSPSRLRYDHVGTLAITGAGFTADPNLAVLIDGTPATNVSVSSYTDLTCDAPAGLLPGPHDVTVTDQFGSATLAGGLLLTPAMFIDGDPRIGSRVYLRYEFDPLDSTFAIYGLPPQVTIPTPPFGGLLGIVPFFPLFTLKSFPSDEFIVHADIPNDPALSGVTVLFQSLTGPNFTGSGKDAAWSNVASITIH